MINKIRKPSGVRFGLIMWNLFILSIVFLFTLFISILIIVPILSLFFTYNPNGPNMLLILAPIIIVFSIIYIIYNRYKTYFDPIIYPAFIIDKQWETDVYEQIIEIMGTSSIDSYEQIDIENGLKFKLKETNVDFMIDVISNKKKGYKSKSYMTREMFIDVWFNDKKIERHSFNEITGENRTFRQKIVEFVILSLLSLGFSIMYNVEKLNEMFDSKNLLMIIMLWGLIIPLLYMIKMFYYHNIMDGYSIEKFDIGDKGTHIFFKLDGHKYSRNNFKNLVNFIKKVTKE